VETYREQLNPPTGGWEDDWDHLRYRPGHREDGPGHGGDGSGHPRDPAHTTGTTRGRTGTDPDTSETTGPSCLGMGSDRAPVESDPSDGKDSSGYRGEYPKVLGPYREGPVPTLRHG
jgi:hypothetical protein